jgi:ADP-ribose pyrophosphatase YjhB (NUDIX family)
MPGGVRQGPRAPVEPPVEAVAQVGAAAPVVGVGAVVLRGVDEGAPEVLLIRRGHAPAKGTWSLPGGRLDRSERLVEAAAREVREETGLDVEIHELIEVVELVSDEFHYVVMDFRASPRDPGAAPTAGDDADDARWVSLAGADALDAFAPTEAVRRVIAKALAGARAPG